VDFDFELTERQRLARERGLALGRGLTTGADAAAVVREAATTGLIDPAGELLAAAVAVEAMATECASGAIALALHTAALAAFEGPALAALTDGSRVAAFTLSTDDLPAVRDSWITGRASWVGPLTTRGVALVAGREDDELLACAVDLDGAGVAIEAIATAALAGLAFGHVTFDGAACQPLGSPLPLMGRVRVLLAAAGLGMGRRALREALAAARVYKRTGAGGEQTVQGLLADAATELDAAMLLMWKAAHGAPISLAEASMAKLAATGSGAACRRPGHAGRRRRQLPHGSHHRAAGAGRPGAGTFRRPHRGAARGGCPRHPAEGLRRPPGAPRGRSPMLSARSPGTPPPRCAPAGRPRPPGQCRR
jgi:alkylation response protein AidB-like acyl-CoA dehydrogenase